MKASQIAAYEADFRENGRDSGGRPFSLNPITAATAGFAPGTQERVNVVLARPKKGVANYWYEKKYAKKRIVLHFTAGFLKGDVATLTRPNYHVSVPFVIARDGTIYNLFDSELWSYHLGEGAVGGNTTMSRSSIGIEISNIGPLVQDGNNLESTYGAVYCARGEGQYYQTLPTAYRGYRHYATFTEEQYRSTIALVRFLCAKFGIPRTFVPEANRFNSYSGISSFSGIASHVNFRKDKFDIGPAFDWARVVDGVCE